MVDRTIYSDGLSKAYAMCGWRMGLAVAPLPMAQRMETLMIISSSCAAAFTQMAGIEALSPRSDASVQAMVAEFKRRRDLVVDRLNQLPGVHCHKPLGAFYVFPNITGTGQNERELADRMLLEGGVAVLAGSTFGEAVTGELRLSYSNSAAPDHDGL